MFKTLMLVKSIKMIEAGLERYAKLLKDEYSVNGKIDTQALLNSDFARPKKVANMQEMVIINKWLNFLIRLILVIITQ